eukprot:GILJ01029691.1.p1 GENE.GILJ01029691.1~~GILJ01029691.1.p1  ORF type:complete len:344 (-),score=66.53 GILJ01029691.1:225-1256(-)
MPNDRLQTPVRVKHLSPVAEPSGSTRRGGAQDAEFEVSIQRQVDDISNVLLKFQQQVGSFEHEGDSVLLALQRERERVYELEKTLAEAKDAYDAKKAHLETLLTTSDVSIKNMQAVLSKAGTRVELEEQINQMARQLQDALRKAEDGGRYKGQLAEETEKNEAVQNLLFETQRALEGTRTELREVIDDNKRLLQALATRDDRDSRDVISVRHELQTLKGEHTVVLNEMRSKTEWGYEIQQDAEKAKKELRKLQMESEQMRQTIARLEKDHEENLQLKTNLENTRSDAEMTRTMLEVEKSRRMRHPGTSAHALTAAGMVDMADMKQHLEHLQVCSTHITSPSIM